MDWNNKELALELIKSSTSLRSILNKMNLKDFRNNRLKLKSFINGNNIDITHLTMGKRIDIIFEEIPLEEYFVDDSKRDNNQLKKKILKYNLLLYKCEGCENQGVWKNKEISLHIDHINGKREDNRLQNLRFLCPNCHSQEPTSNKGKISKIEKKKAKPKYIPKIVYKIEWPDDKRFQELLNNYPVKKIGKILGVSGVNVAKHGRRRGLTFPTDVYGKGYWLKKEIVKKWK